MRVVALKDLTYSPDGIRIEAAQKDQEFDCPDGIVADYVAAGLIGPPGPPRSAERYNFETGSEELEVKPGALIRANSNPEDTPKNTQEPTPDQSEAIAAKEAAAAAADAAARDAAKIEAAEAEAAAKAAEADAAPKHPKAARKPKSD